MLESNNTELMESLGLTRLSSISRNIVLFMTLASASFSERIESVMAQEQRTTERASDKYEDIASALSPHNEIGKYKLFSLEISKGNYAMISFMDDGLGLTINGHVFRLKEIDTHYGTLDLEMMNALIGEDGITDITHDTKTLTFQSGKNSLSVSLYEFKRFIRLTTASHAKKIIKRASPHLFRGDSEDGEDPTDAFTIHGVSYAVQSDEVLGMSLPKTGMVHIVLREIEEPAESELAKMHD